MNTKQKFAGAIPALVLAFCTLPAAHAQDNLVAESTVISACGKLFSIDSNADGLTAGQRAKIVQRNLDNALIAAKFRTPTAVSVQLKNRNPIVTVDNYMIVTADGNSATRNGITQMQLAEKWADSIRCCLADASAIDKYISMLTGKYPEAIVVDAGLKRDEIAVAPEEMLFAIQLVTPISTRTAKLGDAIEAVLSTDVPLRTSFATYLPAGTAVLGEIVSAHKFTPNDYAGKNAFTVQFYEFRTPDGKKIPIDGHIMGGLNTWRMIHTQPTTAESVPNGTTIKNDSLVTMHVNPAKGYIVGSWKGRFSDESAENEMIRRGMPRTIFQRRSTETFVSAGEPMLMQLAATTSIAISGKSL